MGYRGELVDEEMWRDLPELIDERRYDNGVYQPKADPFFELKADVKRVSMERTAGS